MSDFTVEHHHPTSPTLQHTQLSKHTHHIGYSVDLGSGIHDVEFLGVVGLQDGLEEGLVLRTLLALSTHQRLTAAGDGGVCDWVEPRESL